MCEGDWKDGMSAATLWMGVMVESRWWPPKRCTVPYYLRLKYQTPVSVIEWNKGGGGKIDTPNIYRVFSPDFNAPRCSTVARCTKGKQRACFPHYIPPRDQQTHRKQSRKPASRLLDASPEIVFMPGIESINDDCIRNPAIRANASPCLGSLAAPKRYRIPE